MLFFFKIIDNVVCVINVIGKNAIMKKPQNEKTMPKNKVVRAASRIFFGKPQFSALNFIFLVRGLQTTEFRAFSAFSAFNHSFCAI